MRSYGTRAVLGIVALVLAVSPASGQSAPRLGQAASFAILGHSAVSNVGPTHVIGNVGTSPGGRVTGFPPGVIRVGAIENGALASQARVDANAVDDLLGQRPCDSRMGGSTLGGQTFGPGVHCFTSPEVLLNGTLILDAGGNRDAVWILRFENGRGTFTTAADASVLVVGNGYDGNVFWRTGPATLGPRTSLLGNVFATDVTFGQDARLSGRAFARTGAVALNANTVSLCCAPLTLSPASLAKGTLGMPYPETVMADGGLPPYTFAVTSGSLPLGLTLAPNGTIEGTPQTLGRFALTITATDAAGCATTAAYTIVIKCGPRTVLQMGTAGADYGTVTLFPAGTCAIAERPLPPGLELGADCTLFGKPDTTGSFDFAVDNTDAAGARRSHCYTITIGPCPIELSPTAPPPGTMCTRYGGHVFSAAGGTERYVFTASGLPDGLTLSPESGELSGTPATAGSYPVTVTVTDALLRSCSRNYTITIACPSSPREPAVLRKGIVCRRYEETLSPLCGGPAAFSRVSGTLPPGVTLGTDGKVAGTPSEPGTYAFVITAATGGCEVEQEITVKIKCPPITLSDLPPMVQGVPYDQPLTVTAGECTDPYVTSAVGLPSGIEIEDLRIHGEPAEAGPYAFTITAVHEDSGCAGSRSYDPNCPALTMEPPLLPEGAECVAYPETTLSVTGGTAPYTFSVVSGSLPPGLTLSPEGTISGVPAAAGSYAFVVHAADAYGCSPADVAYTIEVGAFACPPVVGPAVPTLSQWALLILSLALAAGGMVMTRRL